MLSERLIQLIRNPETPPFLLREAVMDEEGRVPNVYVVSGATGEHSDLTSWTVAAFLDKEQAAKFCERLNAWCIEHNISSLMERYPNGDKSLKHPLDNQFGCDYTGTAYSVCEIPLRVEEESEM